MRRSHLLGPLAVLVLALGVLVLPNVFAGPRAVHGTGDVFLLVPNLPPPPGELPVTEGAAVAGATASIHRNARGVTINIHTVGLDPHHAYTVWAVEIDSGAAIGPPIQLAGHIVGGSGAGNFSGRLALGGVPTMPVQNPFGEFHCIIADHGPLDPSDLPAAIKSGLPPFSGATQNWEQVVIFEP